MKSSKENDRISIYGSINFKALKDAGAKKIYVCCTHPLLSGDAVQKLYEAPIEEVICTNTIQLPEEKKITKIVQLSVAELLGQGIINIIDDQGVSTLFK